MTPTCWNQGSLVPGWQGKWGFTMTMTYGLMKTNHAMESASTGSMTLFFISLWNNRNNNFVSLHLLMTMSLFFLGQSSNQRPSQIMSHRNGYKLIWEGIHLDIGLIRILDNPTIASSCASKLHDLGIKQHSNEVKCSQARRRISLNNFPPGARSISDDRSAFCFNLDIGETIRYCFFNSF